MTILSFYLEPNYYFLSKNELVYWTFQIIGRCLVTEFVLLYIYFVYYYYYYYTYARRWRLKETNHDWFNLCTGLRHFFSSSPYSCSSSRVTHIIILLCIVHAYLYVNKLRKIGYTYEELHQELQLEGIFQYQTHIIY